MADDLRKRRWFSPTPGWLVLALLAVEGFLWLSERFQWFWFNEKNGWTVLIAVASVGILLGLMLLWFAVALLLRWRFQFSIRSLLVLTVAVALPFSWLAVEMRQARRERQAAAAIQELGGKVDSSQSSGPAWLPSFLQEDVAQAC